MPIAIDTETTLASNEEPVPRLVSVAFADDVGAALYAAHDPALPARLAQAFEDVVVLANAPFDVNVLGRAFPELWPAMLAAYHEERIADVLTRAKMLDMAEGTPHATYGLGDVAERLAGIELDKEDPWRRRYELLLGLDPAVWPEDARSYALADATATLAVYRALEERRAQHQRDVFADAGRTAAAHLALYDQTLRGILTDPEAVEELDRGLGERLDQLAARLMYHGLARVGGTKKAPKIVRNQNAARDLMESISGQRSLSAEALTKAGIPPEHPLSDYAERGGVQRLRTLLVPILRRPIIRTRYDVIKVTGRTGSSGPQGKRKPHEVEPWEWIGTNVQNLPTEGGFRECLVPRPGNVFVAADWGGMELGTQAQNLLDLFGSSPLADVLREGRNPHTEFACRMLGIDTAQYSKENPDHVLHRNIAKKFNFGKWGGMGDPRFHAILARDGFDLTLAQVRKYSGDWRKLWDAGRYFDYIESQRAPDGQITIVIPRTGLICGGRSFTEACNLMFQGLAAAAAKTALWWLWLAQRDPASPLHDCPQVLFVHDENVTECPADRAEAVQAEQERIMVAAFKFWCPDVPISVDSWVGDRYRK